MKKTSFLTNSSNNFSINISYTKKKKPLKPTRVSKKLRYIDNSAIAKLTYLIKF